LYMKQSTGSEQETNKLQIHSTGEGRRHILRARADPRDPVLGFVEVEAGGAQQPVLFWAVSHPKVLEDLQVNAAQDLQTRESSTRKGLELLLTVAELFEAGSCRLLVLLGFLEGWHAGIC